MRIQELELKTGLERATIRFYEREGLIVPERAENGYRSYSEEDAVQLLKIKLLRQLGMSLDKIRQLRGGNENFTLAMEEQIEALSERIEEQKRARIICRQLQEDGVNYATMNPEYYLKLLREVHTEKPFGSVKPFHENVPKPIHPWRRFIARSLDYGLFDGGLLLLLYVIFRIRPIPYDYFTPFLAMIFGFLYVPVEAFLIHKWGTTPGKWAMGIRLDHFEGGKLDIWDAWFRSWRVWKYGMGLGIPYVSIFANIRAYCNLTGTSMRRWRRFDDPVDPPADMEWDDTTEIIYEPWEGRTRNRVLPLLLVCLVLSVVTICDIPKPSNRESNLTIAQFAENYNDTLRLLQMDGTLGNTLNSDGSREQSYSGPVAGFDGGTPIGSEKAEFSYETEGEYLKRITYNRAMTDVVWYHPLDGMCSNAAITLMLSQPESDLLDLIRFLRIWEREKMKSKASIQYENLEIRWTIRTSNVTVIDRKYIVDNTDRDSSVDIEFVITIEE